MNTISQKEKRLKFKDTTHQKQDKWLSSSSLVSNGELGEIVGETMQCNAADAEVQFQPIIFVVFRIEFRT